jgi:hypothetical protein
MKVAVLALILVSVVGCGSGKSLFSSWTSQSTGAVYDFSAGQMGSFQMVFIFAGGGQCEATVTMGGSEESGSYVLSDAAYTSGGLGDPGCGSINGSGSFTKTDTILTICPSSGGCATLE